MALSWSTNSLCVSGSGLMSLSPRPHVIDRQVMEKITSEIGVSTAQMAQTRDFHQAIVSFSVSLFGLKFDIDKFNNSVLLTILQNFKYISFYRKY